MVRGLVTRGVTLLCFSLKNSRKKYFEIEFTPNLEDYLCVLNQLALPVAELFMKEVTKVLFEKMSNETKLWACTRKIIGSTVFIRSNTWGTPETITKWILKRYREGIFKKCGGRLLFFERRGIGYNVQSFYFSNGKLTKSGSVSPLDMFSIRGVDLEEGWILYRLRQGLDPLEEVAFSKFCKKYRLDFFPISEYASLVEKLLVYTLAGENGVKPEYEELEKQGKIPYEYLDSARAYLKYRDILESVKE